MCRRALESKGEMRTSRCTPDSVFSQPWALWPLMRSVAGLDAGLVAGRLFDHLDLEFPPLGPARIHAHAACAPSRCSRCRRRRNELRHRCRWRRPRRRAAPRSAGARASAFSAFSSAMPSCFGRRVALRLRQARPASRASSRSRSKRASEPSRSSSSVRSRITFCAASASFQRFGSSALAFSSARRRVGGIDVKDASSAVPWTA